MTAAFVLCDSGLSYRGIQPPAPSMNRKHSFATLLLFCSPMAAQVSLPAAKSVVIDETAALARVSAIEMERIITLLEGDADADWEPTRASDLRFKRVVLAGPDNDGLLVRATSTSDCGATGNCQVWVLHRSHGKLQLVLSGLAEDVLLAEQKAHGLINIILQANESADSSGLVLCTFDGRKYAARECYKESIEGAARKKSIRRIPCK